MMQKVILVHRSGKYYTVLKQDGDKITVRAICRDNKLDEKTFKVMDWFDIAALTQHYQMNDYIITVKQDVITTLKEIA